MTEKAYKVKVSGPGLHLEREVPEALVNKVVLLVLGGKSDSSSETEVENERRDPPVTKKGKTPSLREFLDSCEPKRIPDWIAAIGYYLQEYR